MYKLNVFLKLILWLLLTIVIVVSNNYIVFWFLLLFLTFTNLFLKQKKEVILDLVLIFIMWLLILVSDKFLILFKILFIVNITLTFIHFFTSHEKRYIKETVSYKNNKYYRYKFYNDSFDEIYEDSKKIRDDSYPSDCSFDDSVERDLERKYLQARMRFYGYRENSSELPEWDKIDTMILMLALLIFMILLILR